MPEKNQKELKTDTEANEKLVADIAAKHTEAFLSELQEKGLLEPTNGTTEAVKDAMSGMAIALVEYGGDVSDREGFAGVVDPEGVQKRDEAMRMAKHDELTNVLNRKGLKEYIEATETTPPQAVVYVDLTNFKAINDNISHNRGDEVLQDTAAILSIGLREGDAVARIGGDEFIVILCDTRSDSKTQNELITTNAVSERIIQATDEYLAKEENKDIAKQGFNMAVGAIDWTSEDTLESVLEKAEKKMKEHKEEQHETLGSHR